MLTRHDNEKLSYSGGPDGTGVFYGEMPHTITVLPSVKARTPRYVGAEVEYQDYADEVNIWDFVRDSGMQMSRSRSFDGLAHDLSGSPYPYEDYIPRLESRQEFDAWKQEFLKNPRSYVHPDSFDFSRQLPAEGGIPDKSAAHIIAAGVTPCVQMQFRQTQQMQVLKTWHLTQDFPTDSEIDWTAFANAFLHYYMVIDHFTGKFGCSYYMLDNEPYPEPSKPYPSPADPLPEGADPEACRLTQFYWQLGLLSQAARMAMEEIRRLLPDRDLASRLFLSGFAVFLNPDRVGDTGAAFLDALDCHHYGRNPENFSRRFRGIQKMFPDKKIFCSEFNVRGGPVHPDHSFFAVTPCLEFGELMMQVLSLSDPACPGLESAMMYQFSYPATHRTLKSLVYGDMNVADLFSVWGREKMVMHRPAECHPTMEESQIRFQTMAYQIYRMLARCVPGSRKAVGNDVLDTYDSAFDSNRIQLVDNIRTLAVQDEKTLYISILNANAEPLHAPLTYNLSRLGKTYRYAILRTTARMTVGSWLDDRVISVEEIRDGKVVIPRLFGESFNQLILTNVPLDRIEKLELREETVTPGSVRDNLRLYQTTILVPYGLIDGEYVCLKDLNVVWESTEPDLVCAYQSGLIQRVRDTRRAVTVTASVMNKPELSASVTFPGSLAD